MIAVGLTGGIGAGKSTVSAALARRGAVVIDADAITREVQQPGTEVFAAIVERFGAGVVGADGNLDRQALADVVFADPEQLAELGKIVHPAVGAEIARRLEAERATDHVVILDVPLMAESERLRPPHIVVVDVDPEIAVERLVHQRGMREDDARARMARQASREDRRAIASKVVDNSGSLESLEVQLDDLWAWMTALPPDPGTTVGEPAPT